MGSGLVVSQVNNNGAIVRDSELNAIGATSISSTVNIDAIPSSSTSGDISNTAKQETGSSTLNVNSILNDADSAVIAAQTIALAPGTMTANGNLINSNNTILGPAAAAAAVAASNDVGGASNSGTKANGFPNPAVNINNLTQYVLPTTAVQGLPTNAPAPVFNNAPVPLAAVTPAAPVDPNNANATTHHLQSAILQQNAAIMQQNAATLQHLQTLHQTNKLLATNPETLGMLTPIMNMTNPVQLLAPGLNLNPNGTFLPMANLADMNGSLATAPIGTQLQQQQQQTIPIPAPATAPGAPQAFPVVANNGVVNNGLDASNNDAVQNFLRTAFMLQNGGLPFGMIPQPQQQQQQALLSAPAAPGNLMLVPNAPAPFGILPATVDSDKSKGDVTNGAAAAAAANAAASVLPPASMNLPLQQQLQQQQQHWNAVPQMRIDLNSSNNNNAIALLNGTTLNAANNGFPIAGLTTLQQQQQQQQQRNPAMVFSGMNLEGQLPLPLLAPTTQQKQQLVVSNPVANAIPQAQPAQKKSKTISRPLYLDHDSNCLTAYQCFLRKQIELFEVGHDEMTGTAQGRNTPLQYGQVGIRCRHCSHLPKSARARGGVYYSRTIDGVYQVAQNMSKLHFLKSCTLIPENTKNQLKSLQSVSSRASGGKEYWAEGLRVLGIVEEGGMLRFSSNSASSSNTNKSTE